MNKSSGPPALFAQDEFVFGGALSSRVRQLAAATFESARSFAGNAYARYRERQRRQAAFRAMSHLSDHLLRDVGFERGPSYQPKENYDVYRY